jgi:hypothetical protein
MAGHRTTRTVLAVGNKIPAYPGRARAEALTAALLGEGPQHFAGHVVQRMLGFWVLVQAYGSFDAFKDSGMVSVRGAYGQRTEFAKVFGVDVEDFHNELAKPHAIAFGVDA